MGLRKQASSTRKVTISNGWKEEISSMLRYDIASKVKTFKIPPPLVINFDQTPSKFVLGNGSSDTVIGSETMPIAGSTDKRMITLTFCITPKGDFLPIQIYGGKTNHCIPRVSFPSSFCICENEKYYSSKAESLKLIDEVIIPYV